MQRPPGPCASGWASVGWRRTCRPWTVISSPAWPSRPPCGPRSSGVRPCSSLSRRAGRPRPTRGPNTARRDPWAGRWWAWWSCRGSSRACWRTSGPMATCTTSPAPRIPPSARTCGSGRSWGSRWTGRATASSSCATICATCFARPWATRRGASRGRSEIASTVTPPAGMRSSSPSTGNGASARPAAWSASGTSSSCAWPSGSQATGRSTMTGSWSRCSSIPGSTSTRNT